MKALNIAIIQECDECEECQTMPCEQKLCSDCQDTIADLKALHIQAFAAAVNAKPKENSPGDPTRSTDDIWSARVRELVIL